MKFKYQVLIKVARSLKTKQLNCPLNSEMNNSIVGWGGTRWGGMFCTEKGRRWGWQGTCSVSEGFCSWTKIQSEGRIWKILSSVPISCMSLTEHLYYINARPPYILQQTNVNKKHIKHGAGSSGFRMDPSFASKLLCTLGRLHNLSRLLFHHL